MSLKKTSLLVALTCVFFSGEPFAKKIVEASEDTKRHTLTKQRVIRTSKTTQKKSLPLVQSTKRGKRGLTTLSTDTRRNTPRRSVFVKKKATVATTSRKRIVGKNSTIKNQTPPKTKAKRNLAPRKSLLSQRINPPVATTPAKTATRTKIDENEVLFNSNAQLSKTIDALDLVLTKNDGAFKQLNHEMFVLANRISATSKEAHRLSEIVMKPGFEQKFLEHFNRLNDKKKEELRKLLRTSLASTKK